MIGDSSRSSLSSKLTLPKLDRAHRRDREAVAFLPAALEALEAPPSPTARIAAWLFSGLVVAALLAAYVGRVDVITVADGQVVPSGRIKFVQPLEIATVRAIHVKDGAIVRSGDSLIELEIAGASAEYDRLLQEIAAAKAIAARARALLSDPSLAGAERAFQPPDDVDAATVLTQQRLLVAQVAEQHAKLRQIDDELARRRANERAVEAAIRRLDQTIPLVRERAEARHTLAEKGYGSRLQYLEVQQQLVERQEERSTMQHRLAEARAAIAEVQSQRAQAVAEFQRSTAAELAQAELRESVVAQDLLKAEQRRNQQTLTSPIDGVVQELSVHTLGGIVTPAQKLMAIVPQNDSLEIEAMILNRDIGFVHEGQDVDIKIEAFTFTRYGTVPGRVAWVSKDAIPDEKRGLVYAARVHMLKSALQIDGKEISFGPGMVATAEIRTGERRIIDYLFSTFSRYSHDALRER